MSKHIALALLGAFFPISIVWAAGGGGGGGGGSFIPAEPAPTVLAAPAPTPTTTPVPTVVTMPVPEAAEWFARAPKFVASQLPKCDQTLLFERVRCRLSLTEEELTRELTIKYLPEECRALADGQQAGCVSRYRALHSCWEKPVGLERSRCAATKIALKGSPAAALKKCAVLKGSLLKKTCTTEVRNKVYGLIKFRLYDLSERAEDLLEKGVTVEAVARLVTFMEERKQSFNQATSYKERRSIILAARAEWKKFVRENKGKLPAVDYLDQALVDLQAVR